MTFGVLRAPVDLAQALQLRHAELRVRMGWLPVDGDGLDLDRADLDAIHLGVKATSGTLLAYGRIVLRRDLWMIGREFREPAELHLATWAAELRCSSAEVSRFVATDGLAARLLVREGLNRASRAGLGAVVGVTHPPFLGWLRLLGLPVHEPPWTGCIVRARLPFSIRIRS